MNFIIGVNGAASTFVGGFPEPPYDLSLQFRELAREFSSWKVVRFPHFPQFGERKSPLLFSSHCSLIAEVSPNCVPYLKMCTLGDSETYLAIPYTW